MAAALLWFKKHFHLWVNRKEICHTQFACSGSFTEGTKASVSKHLSETSLKQAGSSVPVAGGKSSTLNAVDVMSIPDRLRCGWLRRRLCLFTRREWNHLSASAFTHCRRHSFPLVPSPCISIFFSPRPSLLSFILILAAQILCRPSSVSPSVALPLSCHISVYFCQSDAGTRHSGPTRHSDSNNCLTRENKFHSQTWILMDWPVFFFPSLFFLSCIFFSCLPPPYFGLLLSDRDHLLPMCNSYGDCDFKFLAGTPKVKAVTLLCLCLRTSFTDSEQNEKLNVCVPIVCKIATPLFYIQLGKNKNPLFDLKIYITYSFDHANVFFGTNLCHLNVLVTAILVWLREAISLFNVLNG